MAGQSFNPSASSHKSVLKQVLQEEEKEIEAAYRGSLAHIKEGAAAIAKDIQDEGSEQEDSGEDSEKPEMTNKAIDRNKKLTKTQRNQKIKAKANREL